MRRRLEDIFRPVSKIAYQEVHALPKIDEIRLNGPRVCLVLSPDSKIAPAEAQAVLEFRHGEEQLLRSHGRWLQPRQSRRQDAPHLGHRPRPGRNRRRQIAAQIRAGGRSRAGRTRFQRHRRQPVQPRLLPDQDSGLTAAKLSMTFAGNQFRAEEQIEKALADVGASKFYRNVEDNAEMLITRAEDMLWPARRRPPRSLARRRQPRAHQRALALAAPKGLEALRKIAEGQGRWRYSEDGYIEKGPFPKPADTRSRLRTRLQRGNRQGHHRGPRPRRRAARPRPLC